MLMQSIEIVHTQTENKKFLQSLNIGDLISLDGRLAWVIEKFCQPTLVIDGYSSRAEAVTIAFENLELAFVGPSRNYPRDLVINPKFKWVRDYALVARIDYAI